MLEKCSAIVLQTIPHTGNAIIMHLLTESHGRLPFYYRRSKAKSASIKPAHLLPLTLVEIDFEFRQDAHFQRLVELRCTPLLLNIQSQPAKAALVLFLQEFLIKLLPEALLNKPLFTFVQAAVQVIDHSHAGFRHFPPYFSFHVMRHLGHAPSFQKSYGQLSSVSEPAAQYRTEIQEYLEKLSRCPFEDLESLAFGKETSRKCLSYLLEVLNSQQPEVRPIQSHRILSEVF